MHQRFHSRERLWKSGWRSEAIASELGAPVQSRNGEAPHSWRSKQRDDCCGTELEVQHLRTLREAPSPQGGEAVSFAGLQ